MAEIARHHFVLTPGHCVGTGAAEDDGRLFEEKFDRLLATLRVQFEALVGADNRLDTVVQDILTHFDARLVAMDGKAMIVCMSRRICAEV